MNSQGVVAVTMLIIPLTDGQTDSFKYSLINMEETTFCLELALFNCKLDLY